MTVATVLGGAGKSCQRLPISLASASTSATAALAFILIALMLRAIIPGAGPE